MKLLTNSPGHQIFYTMESLTMAVIASNFLLAVIGICLYSRKILKNTGYKILLIFMVMTILRFLFPVDLPFSKVVALPEKISELWELRKLISWNLGKSCFDMGDMLKIIWWSVGIISFIRYILEIRRSRRYIRYVGHDITEEVSYSSCMERICRERKRKNIFRILKIDGIKAPMIFGILKPCILIPETMELDDQELYYVLSHEASHYFHGDLYVKFVINLLAAVYWWNPFVYLFRRQTNLLLEMQVDDKVTRKDSKRSVEYLNCLIHLKESIVEQKSDSKQGISDKLSINFFRIDNRTDLQRRFGMMADATRKRNYGVNICLTGLILVIYFLSYRFIFEACYSPFDKDINIIDQNVMFFPQVDEIYAIEDMDGNYSIFYEKSGSKNDFFIEKVESLKDWGIINKVYYLEKGKYSQ